MSEFRDFEPHDGGPCPYAPEERVDVQFRDLRVEYDAEARYWGEGKWGHTSSGPSSHIIRHRLASNRFHRDGLETE